MHILQIPSYTVAFWYLNCLNSTNVFILNFSKLHQKQHMYIWMLISIGEAKFKLVGVKEAPVGSRVW